MAKMKRKRYTEPMYIGVDIGGSKILVAASHDGREILRQQKIKTPKEGDQIVAEIIHLIEEIAAGEKVRAIGIGTAGSIDRARGIILKSPNISWKALPIGERLKTHFGVPIRVENDADAAALAESSTGAAKDHNYALYVTISTGVGNGLIIDGDIYHGVDGTEGGHMIIDPNGPPCSCGGRGHFESMVSGPAIKQRYGKYGYEINDPAIWDEIAATMALGFHNLITVYAPSIVVIGGGMGVHFDRFGEFLITHLNDLKPMYPLPSIVPAKHIETAVVYGALILAARSAR